jgi:hypothetical protein
MGRQRSHRGSSASGVYTTPRPSSSLHADRRPNYLLARVRVRSRSTLPGIHDELFDKFQERGREEAPVQRRAFHDSRETLQAGSYIPTGRRGRSIHLPRRRESISSTCSSLRLTFRAHRLGPAMKDSTRDQTERGAKSGGAPSWATVTPTHELPLLNRQEPLRDQDSEERLLMIREVEFATNRSSQEKRSPRTLSRLAG